MTYHSKNRIKSIDNVSNLARIEYLDLEVRSQVDLKKYGLMRYAEDASTEVISMSKVTPAGKTGEYPGFAFDLASYDKTEA